LLAHLARAEVEDRAAFEAPEHLLCERCRRGRDRGRTLANRRLRAHLPARVQRLPEDAVEERPGRTELVRKTHLAEDLALARDKRVEPGGDSEEVMGRGPVLQAVERGLDLRPERGERRDRVALRLLDVLGRDVELGAVAGREAGCLASALRQPGG